MNQLKLCAIIIINIIFVSCLAHYTRNKTILEAEKVMFTATDSSFRLLSSIQQPEKMSKADYASWCLNYTHARYKLHKEIKSDSLIRIAVEYYKNSRLIKQSGTAYYLLGCINMKLKKDTVALEAFKQAENVLIDTKEYKLIGLIDFNIGYLYMQDEIYNQSLSYLKKSLKYFYLSNDKIYQAYACREISNMCYEMDYPFKNVLYFSNQSLKLSKEAGDSINYYNILCRQGVLLYNRDYNSSKEYILKGYRVLPDKKSYHATILSYLYAKLNKPDSANYYLRISSSDTFDINSKKLRLVTTAYLKRGAGNYKSAFEDMEKAYLLRDSIFQKRIKSQLYRIDKQYDSAKKEKEKDELKISNRNKVILIGVLLIVILVISITLLLANRSHKKKQNAHAMEKQRLEYEVNTKQLENDKKREILLAKLQNKIENTLRFERLKLGVKVDNKLENFIEEITKQSVFSNKERDYYIDEADDLFDGKITNLKTENPQLTKQDLIVITLISLQIKIADSCILLNMSQNTMYKRRDRIINHIGLSSITELETWVIQNVVKAG